MSHTIELTDEQYQTLKQTAEARGESPDELLADLILSLHEQPATTHALATEDWFRHLGVTEEQIAEAKRIARERADANA